MAYLTLVLENREVRKFVLGRSVTTIGRSQENDIVINNLALSRQHAQVEFRSGNYAVQDLKSQNGVYVNGKRIHDPVELGDGDRITLGTYQFVFKDEAGSVERPKVRAAPKPVPSQAPPPPEDEEQDESVPLLVLKYNDMELQRFPLKSGDCTVGRAKECDIQIPERRLSRNHCRIVRDDRGRVRLEDLGSQNGTYVNRRRIRGNHDLTNGDVLNFAEYSILFLSHSTDYSGPDSVHAGQAVRAINPRNGDRAGNGDIAIEETMMPPAYGDESDEPVRPTEDWEDPERDATPAPPVMARPRERDRPSAPPAERSRQAPERERKDERKEDRNKERPSAPARPGFVGEAKGEPIVEPPDRARDRARRRGEESKPAPERPKLEPPKRRGASQRPPPVGDPRSRPKRSTKERTRRPDEVDVPDRNEMPAPDEDLDEWYKARDEKSNLYDPINRDPPEDESALLKRSQSSISRVLEPMTVNKHEIDHNLRKRAQKRSSRRFYVEVFHDEKKLFSGPLTEPVTILGKDPESDIQIKGRYVAGRHSLFVMVRDSLLLVRLGSSSATRVNGLPKLQAFLKAGDIVQIDETTIKIAED
ncbi:MAG: FHA domain-containing protein [Deltaproteobacteria bacterium]|nr:FHA domain-containing protein [Deltaproteobacteria bacterium]